MDRVPTVLVLVDPQHESIAVSEANKVGAATVALIDTDGDPDEIDIPIPGNDDSMKVVQIVVSKLADAVIEGKTHPIGMPRPEEISKAGAVSVSVPERPGAITVGKGGRPRRASTPGRGSPPRPPAQPQPSAPPPAAPAGA
jgi:small subunit ribosomal protein S2